MTMKKCRFITLMAILLMAGVSMVQAQQLEPLVAEGKQWNVVLTYVPWPPIHRETNAYKVEGDTVVDGTTYKKLLTTQSEQFDNWELCGVLRETGDGQVFHRNYGWNHTFGAENLLYNFSMQPGDSICYSESSCLLLLQKSDTILDDGSVRKRYDFQYKEGGYLMNEYETWVEGIGSEYGLLHSGSRALVGGTYDLLCYYEDEDPIWQNTDFNSCYMNGYYADTIGTKFYDEASGLYYKVSTEYTVEVTCFDPEFNHYTGSVEIPSSVEHEGMTYTVIAIGDMAFVNCPNLTSVTIPNTVVSVGEKAFNNTGLVSIAIPNSVSSMGDNAFRYCPNLVSVTLSDAMTEIPSEAFVYCASLADVTLPSILESIGQRAFEGCVALSSLTLPNGLYAIGASAFYNSGLTSIVIPNSVAIVEESAFNHCESLVEAHLSESMTVIEPHVFYNCGNLSSVSIPSQLVAIGSSAFYQCVSLEEVPIPPTVTAIGAGAFYGCRSLVSVTLPIAVTSLGAGAFSDCSSLTSVTLPEGLDTIPQYLFSSCHSLASTQTSH